MTTRPLFLALLLSLTALSLSGCGIPGGVAYAIKSVEKKDGGSGQAQNQSAPQPVSQPAAAEPPPAPAPAPRDSIKVEELAPPR